MENNKLFYGTQFPTRLLRISVIDQLIQECFESKKSEELLEKIKPILWFVLLNTPLFVPYWLYVSIKGYDTIKWSEVVSWSKQKNLLYACIVASTIYYSSIPYLFSQDLSIKESWQLLNKTDTVNNYMMTRVTISFRVLSYLLYLWYEYHLSQDTNQQSVESVD